MGCDIPVGSCIGAVDKKLTRFPEEKKTADYEL